MQAVSQRKTTSDDRIMLFQEKFSSWLGTVLNGVSTHQSLSFGSFLVRTSGIPLFWFCCYSNLTQALHRACRSFTNCLSTCAKKFSSNACNKMIGDPRRKKSSLRQRSDRQDVAVRPWRSLDLCKATNHKKKSKPTSLNWVNSFWAEKPLVVCRFAEVLRQSAVRRGGRAQDVAKVPEQKERAFVR